MGLCRLFYKVSTWRGKDDSSFTSVFPLHDTEPGSLEHLLKDTFSTDPLWTLEPGPSCAQPPARAMLLGPRPSLPRLRRPPQDPRPLTLGVRKTPGMRFELT
uniref:Macaca fascicularis brain cDNA clone: QflA-20012, similar to human zinc finger protein 492 (ZNF492), mRNA, RefSeq: XM_047550.5 n=1 Tax=Macaca fascicularis TaxID=9541 RepID=I7GHT8_MACFA|nr:unnamed protein product [Macaca fascicularis]